MALTGLRCTACEKRQLQSLVKSFRQIPQFCDFSVFTPPTHYLPAHRFIMLRTSLGTISGNRRHNTELNPCQRGMILGGQALGHKSSEIAKVLNVPRTTVNYTIQKHSERLNGVTKSRSGRPGVLSDRDRRQIIKYANQSTSHIHSAWYGGRSALRSIYTLSDTQKLWFN